MELNLLQVNFYISRLSREAVRMLIDHLRPLLPEPKRRHAVPVELQV